MHRDNGHDNQDDEGDDAGQPFGLGLAEKWQLEFDAVFGHWCDPANCVAPMMSFPPPSAGRQVALIGLQWSEVVSVVARRLPSAS
jgi:hypothetical protein